MEFELVPAMLSFVRIWKCTVISNTSCQIYWCKNTVVSTMKISGELTNTAFNNVDFSQSSNIRWWDVTSKTQQKFKWLQWLHCMSCGGVSNSCTNAGKKVQLLLKDGTSKATASKGFTVLPDSRVCPCYRSLWSYCMFNISFQEIFKAFVILVLQ
jgi:hypothetical protein